MADQNFGRNSTSPSSAAIAFPAFDASFMEGLEPSYEERFSRQHPPPHYTYPVSSRSPYMYGDHYGPQLYQNAYQSDYYQNSNTTQQNYINDYRNQMPYSNHASSNNMTHSGNSDYFDNRKNTSHHSGANHYTYAGANKNYKQTLPNMLNPSTPSFVPSTPKLSGRGTPVSTTPTAILGLRGTPPTAPRAMLALAVAPRNLHTMDLHPRPTRRTSTTRPDKSLKDVIITPAGILRNVVGMRDMRLPTGDDNQEESGEFAADKYSFAEHWAGMNELEKLGFCQDNFFEFVIDVAAVEEEARAKQKELAVCCGENWSEDEGHSTSNMGAQTDKSRMESSNSSMKLLECDLGKLHFQNEAEEEGGVPLKEQVADEPSHHGKEVSSRVKYYKSNSKQLTRYIKNNLVIPAADIFAAIDLLGPSFSRYATTIFITLKFSSIPPLAPLHFPVLPNQYNAADTPSLPSGAIDTQSTALYLHLSRLVSVLQSFNSLGRLDIVLSTPANTPKPLTIEQLDHVLPFYDLESFTKWRIWWRAEYMTQAEQVNQWPVAHLNSEWGKICTWRDAVWEEEEIRKHSPFMKRDHRTKLV
jgi:hypothetical protein